MLAGILVVLIVIAALVFFLQNAAKVSILFFTWRFEAALANVIFLALLAGLIMGLSLMWWFRIRQLMKSKRHQGESSNPPPAIGGS